MRKRLKAVVTDDRLTRRIAITTAFIPALLCFLLEANRLATRHQCVITMAALGSALFFGQLAYYARRVDKIAEI